MRNVAGVVPVIEESIVKEGYLEKKGKRAVDRFRKRYFCLQINVN